MFLNCLVKLGTSDMDCFLISGQRKPLHFCRWSCVYSDLAIRIFHGTNDRSTDDGRALPSIQNVLQKDFYNIVFPQLVLKLLWLNTK